MVSYYLFLFTLKINNEKKKNTGNQSPCHSSLSGGIICGPIWGSFLVWGSFAVGDHLRRCILLIGKLWQILKTKRNFG